MKINKPFLGDLIHLLIDNEKIPSDMALKLELLGELLDTDDPIRKYIDDYNKSF